MTRYGDFSYDIAIMLTPRIRVTSVEVPLSQMTGSGCQPIYDYWDDVRADRLAPRWPEFDLMALPMVSVPYIHVVDVADGDPRFVFRFWGTGLVDLFHMERTGQSLLAPHDSPFNASRRREVAKDYEHVVETRAPMAFLWDASSARDIGYPLVVPSLRLPISNDGERVSQILTYFDFKDADRAHWRDMFEGRGLFAGPATD